MKRFCPVHRDWPLDKVDESPLVPLTDAHYSVLEVYMCPKCQEELDAPPSP